jgi:hypothetical protein
VLDLGEVHPRRSRPIGNGRGWSGATPTSGNGRHGQGQGERHDTRRDVDDELFARVQRHYDDDTIAELTMVIAWENASSRFNRAFRIPSQGFWKR